MSQMNSMTMAKYRAKKPLAEDADGSAVPPPDPNSVNGIVQRMQNGVPAVPPAAAPAQPAFDPTAARVAYLTRVGNNNAATNSMRDFHAAYQGGAGADQLAVLHKNMDDWRLGTPDQSRLDATRTSMEGPVREAAGGVNTRLAAMKLQQGQSESDTRLLAPKEASVKSGYDVTSAENKSTMGMIPAREAQMRAKLGNEQAQSESATRLIPGSEQATGAQNALNTARAQAGARLAPAQESADASKLAFDKAYNDSLAKGLPAEEAKRIATNEAETARQNVEGQKARFEGGQYSEQPAPAAPGQPQQKSMADLYRESKRAEMEGNIATSRAAAGQKLRESATGLTGTSPDQIVKDAATLTPALGRHFGTTMGLESNHAKMNITGPSIDEDQNALDTFDRSVVSRLEEYAKSDPVGASDAANRIISGLPTPTRGNVYDTGLVASGKLTKFAGHLTAVRGRLLTIATRGRPVSNVSP